MADKKITLATVKSFVKKNFDNLYIKNESDFDGMQDCVTQCEDKPFRKVKKDERDNEYTNKRTLCIAGAWFVGSSRDYFSEYEDNNFTGIEVYNSCGSFILAVGK